MKHGTQSAVSPTSWPAASAILSGHINISNAQTADIIIGGSIVFSWVCLSVKPLFIF